jgi:hypothetical protein
MPRLDDLGDRIGKQLGAAPVHAERAADAIRLQQIDDPPHPDLAAIAAPGNAAEVDDAAFDRARLHAIGRRLALRPSLQHHGDADGDALAVRPAVGLACHGNAA